MKRTIFVNEKRDLENLNKDRLNRGLFEFTHPEYNDDITYWMNKTEYDKTKIQEKILDNISDSKLIKLVEEFGDIRYKQGRDDVYEEYAEIDI